MAAVRLDGVRKAFGTVEVLKGIDLSVEDGEFIVLVGPSGCGKSTLLRAIAGLDDLDAGEIAIGDRVVNGLAPSERGIAMVFQSYALYPQMTLYDNLAFPLKLAKRPKAEIDAAVTGAAQTLGIDHLLDRKPAALSGGQRQRVAIGRAIVREPSVFLFDEPLSNLDAALRGRMRYEFAALHKALATTMVYVTHDQAEAMTLADRIVVLSKGCVEQIGPPLELYDHPANRFVAGFIGSPRMNFLPAHVVEAEGRGAVVKIASGETVRAQVDAARAQPGDAVTLGIRPERVARDREDNTLSTKVRFVEALGNATFAHLDCPGGEDALIWQLSDGASPALGADVVIALPPEHLHLFDGEGRAFQRLSSPEMRHAA